MRSAGAAGDWSVVASAAAVEPAFDFGACRQAFSGFGVELAQAGLSGVDAVVELGGGFCGATNHGVDGGGVALASGAGCGHEGLSAEGCDHVVGGVVQLDEVCVVFGEEVGFGLDERTEGFGATQGDGEAGADGCGGVGADELLMELLLKLLAGEGIEGGVLAGLLQGQELEAEGAHGSEGALVAVGGFAGVEGLGLCGPPLAEALPPRERGRLGRTEDVADPGFGLHGDGLDGASVQVALLERVQGEWTFRGGGDVVSTHGVGSLGGRFQGGRVYLDPSPEGLPTLLHAFHGPLTFL